MIAPLSLVKRRQCLGPVICLKAKKTFIALKTANIWPGRPKCRRWAIIRRNFDKKDRPRNFLCRRVSEERPEVTGKM